MANKSQEDQKNNSIILEKFKNLLIKFNIENCCLTDGFDLDMQNPSFSDIIISHIINEEFQEFCGKEMKAGFAYIHSIKKLLDVNELKNQLVDFLIDEKITIKEVQAKSKEGFSTLFIQLEYLERKVCLLKNIFSGEKIDFPFQNIHLATPYFMFGSISVE